VQPEPLSKDTKAPVGPAGTSKVPYTFKASQMPETKLAGGSVKIVDSTNFNASTGISMAQVTVEPGAIRYAFESILARCELLLNYVYSL
jgi:hypothetical protein